MEKDIDKIPKNQDTDIVIRVDDFGGKVGLTIREFVRSERYTGFTKAGTRIPAEHFKTFKDAINSINEADLVVSQETQAQIQQTAQTPQKQAQVQPQTESKQDKPQKANKAKSENYEELEM